MKVAETIPDINENAVLLEQFKLPDMMAGLLETAINDARGLDRYRYMPDSDHWYNTSNRSSCEVCLSGSVIARSFRIPPDRDMAPFMFSELTMRKLEALDSMRCGNWWHAFVCVYDHYPNRFVESQILALKMPQQSDFHGWDDFETHLSSLQGFLPQLRAIDKTENLRKTERITS